MTPNRIPYPSAPAAARLRARWCSGVNPTGIRVLSSPHRGRIGAELAVRQ
ncbi:MAG: hypothetical protein IPM22_16000 [Betaproteobacteria bacterium]|nr:hypothetical protein [Betaproteobacteria bacterium]MCC7215699.1 hypothetical protein [Burkholderiales bacterium]